MTKAIAAFIVVAFLFVGWRVFLYWDEVQHEEDLKRKQAQAALTVVPEQLAGVPYVLEDSLRKAQQAGVIRFGKWLKANSAKIQDPRKAWLELDYCVALSQNAPNEAKRIYLAVKERTPTNSIVFPRIKQLEKTYQ
jgi:hypothetical protein